MKPLLTALKDGYSHIKSITDPILLRQYREEGVRVDDKGVWEYYNPRITHVRVEPVGEEGKYQVAIYSGSVLLTEKLMFEGEEYEENHG